MRGNAIVASILLLALVPVASSATDCPSTITVPPSCLTDRVDPVPIIEEPVRLVEPVIADAVDAFTKAHSDAEALVAKAQEDGEALAEDTSAFARSTVARAQTEPWSAAQGARDAALAIPDDVRAIAEREARNVCDAMRGIRLSGGDDQFEAAKMALASVSPGLARELGALWPDLTKPGRLCEMRIAPVVLGLLP